MAKSNRIFFIFLAVKDWLVVLQAGFSPPGKDDLVQHYVPN